MTTNNNMLVPIGKYKGQPVEALLADRSYCEWIAAQPWFRERYATVYQTIINYGGEPQETPEHNAMQATFLYDDTCLRLARVLAAAGGYAFPAEDEGLNARSRFEVGGWDVHVHLWSDDDEACFYPASIYVELKPDLGDDFPAVLRQVRRHEFPSPWRDCRCVLVRRYSFESVTWEQVGDMFAASDQPVWLVRESDLF